MPQATKYTVKKRKSDQHGREFYKAVGVVVINDGEGTGVLYLDMFDGPFRLFSDEYYINKEREESHDSSSIEA